MLYLAKFGGIAILIWFYKTAVDKNQSGLKWAIVGLIGYWLTWWLVNLTIVQGMMGMTPKNLTMLFLINQVPAIGAIVAAILIRKKLVTDVEKELSTHMDAGSEMH
jgi:integral membrane sensor domain MASE1